MVLGKGSSIYVGEHIYKKNGSAPLTFIGICDIVLLLFLLLMIKIGKMNNLPRKPIKEGPFLTQEHGYQSV